MVNSTSKQRLAWAITGSGHYLKECIAIIHTLEDVDLFLSKAAAEVLQQYGYKHNVGKVYQDKTASSVPVELFYQGRYHTLIIAPATSNTIAKMVCGISDNLVTNLYAQAGKTRVPSIIFACDTAPELESDAPRDHVVKVYPRNIDLENIQKIKTFEATTVVEDMSALDARIQDRFKELQSSSHG
ncbi:MAG: flavoprotein [Pseudomonadota bacterium]